MRQAGTLFVIFLFCAVASAASIDTWVLQHTENGAPAEFFVVLKQQPDLSPAFSLSRKVDRGRFVYATLYQNAESSQAPLRQWLDARSIPYTSFYIVNALLIKGDRSLIDELAARSDIDRIEGNPVIHNNFPRIEAESEVPSAIEPNITKTGAPQMWAAGFKGQGIVVGGMDTGYRWTHNALKNHYRGWNGTTANHDYNWHDSIHTGGGSCGANSPQPCDDFFHGTHTMGTIVGDDGGTNQIGMAPSAKWIGCRNMDQGNGTPATYLECFQFMLAPYPVTGTPADGDPAMAPDVTSNSWGCPTVEGCSALTLQSAVDAQKAAGIMTVVAAGNSGSACGTVTDPPALYDSAYTVGATNNSDVMASFSSRGQAATTGLMKPDIVAPGVSVRSATNTSDTAYTSASGTSMATPNVAGGVALLWSAVQSLQNQQDSTEATLNTGAFNLPLPVPDCIPGGGDDSNTDPNNTWGNGRMAVFAAYQLACPSAPAAPANVTGGLDGSNHPQISWDAVPSSTQYEVYRGNGACPGTQVNFLTTTVTTSITDTAVTVGSTYSYIVRDLVGGCYSAFSTCVNVTVPCSISILPTSATIGAGGGGGNNVTVTAGSTCGWTAVANDTWLHITAGSSGTGNGTVTYSVDANPDSLPRTGTLTIGGNTFTVNQDAAACTYGLSPSSANYTAAGGPGSGTITAPGGCDWTANSDVAWVTFPNGNTGSGNGTLDYDVAPNPDITPRTGTITVQGQTLTINQDGATCTYGLSPSSANYTAAGGSGSATITTLAGCAWTANSDVAWVTFPNGNTGNGNGTLDYDVAPNPDITPRTGTITLQGQTLTINQDGATCTYGLSPSSANYTAAGGSGSGTITTLAGCAWTANSDVAWVTFPNGNTGNGNGTLDYDVAPNPDITPRTGTITVQGQTLVINQDGAACSYDVSPTGANYTAAGGSGSATITALAGCTWSANSDVAWITFPNGNTGSGDGVLDYDVAANPDSTARQGTITVQGQTLTIDQAAGCLFCDDFEDGVLASDWTYIKPSWSEASGHLIGAAVKKAIAVASPVFSGGCTNCTIHTSLSTSGGHGNRVSLLAWYVDNKNFVELMMKQENGKWILKQRSAGRIVAKAKFFSPAPIVVNQTYAVDLSFDGTTFSLVIDGVDAVALVSGAAVNPGTVGFETRKTTAFFEDILAQ